MIFKPKYRQKEKGKERPTHNCNFSYFTTPNEQLPNRENQTRISSVPEHQKSLIVVYDHRVSAL